MLHVEVTQVSPYWDAGFPFLHPHMQWPSLLLDEDERQLQLQPARSRGIKVELPCLIMGVGDRAGAGMG